MSEPRAELRVEARRNGMVESVHRVSVAVVRDDGALLASAGDPALVTFVRSAAKPFQALPLVEDGAAAAFQVTQQELALACASHNSEPSQVGLVRRFLTRLGFSETDLVCGPHRPLSADFTLADADGAQLIAPQPVPRTPLASNCSGKHTAMLALARHHGWDPKGYHQVTHPVQRRCKESLARWAACGEQPMVEAVDGCGVVTFGLPLTGLGLAYARLVTSSEPAARTVVTAMAGHPNLVAGTGRPCTALLDAYQGRVIAKVGAEGVYGAALVEQKLGIGLKVEDGHNWAAVVALWDVLRQLGLDPPPAARLPQFAELPIRNTRGESVGSLRAAGTLTFV